MATVGLDSHIKRGQKLVGNRDPRAHEKQVGEIQKSIDAINTHCGQSAEHQAQIPQLENLKTASADGQHPEIVDPKSRDQPREQQRGVEGMGACKRFASHW